jgi:hypothetical protein
MSTARCPTPARLSQPVGLRDAAIDRVAQVGEAAGRGQDSGEAEQACPKPEGVGDGGHQELAAGVAQLAADFGGAHGLTGGRVARRRRGRRSRAG